MGAIRAGRRFFERYAWSTLVVGWVTGTIGVLLLPGPLGVVITAIGGTLIFLMFACYLWS